MSISKARFALLSAREFSHMAKSYVPRLKDGNRAEVIVAMATAHTFALELYLKSFIMAKYNKRPWGHDVLELFNQIDDKDARTFEFEWQYYAIGQLREDKVSSPDEIGVVVSFDGANHEYDREPWTVSMRSTLERTRDRFKEWRYLFEQSDRIDADVTVLIFTHEFNSINAMTILLDSSIEKEMGKRSN